ncbi:hypothetical protein [Streptomyces sp. NPDC101234]|uniref:hypothetical protein n=1 Tax=Streptomyces sp. NPDC101234 TaxID=3366138 RepID=UPI003829BE02
MTYAWEHGYPVPRVRPSGSRTDLVMERLSGPTTPAVLPAGGMGCRVWWAARVIR